MSSITLNKIKKNKNTVKYDFSYTSDMARFFSGEPFVIEYNNEINDVPDSILVIPFVSSVLPIIMVADVELHVPEIDKDFLGCIPELASGYETMFPETRFLGKVIPERIVETKTNIKTEEVAMFFSGGLDSVQTLISHIDEKPDLISIWGSDIKYDNEVGWNVLYDVLSNEASKLGLPLITIRSAFRLFDKEGELDRSFSKQLKDGWWHGVKHGIALIGHVAPLAYLYGYKTLYIASTNSVEDKNVRCASNPATDNKIRFCGTKIVHDGYEYNRQDKAHNIVEYCIKNETKIALHVCWKTQTGSNCCVCEKCYRTIFNLLVESADPKDYGFDKMNIFYKTFNHNKLLLEICNHYNLMQYFGSIANRLRMNRRELKKSKDWKYMRWLEKLDINNIKTFQPSKLYVLGKKIKGYLSKIKRKSRKAIDYLFYFLNFIYKYNKKSIVLIGTPPPHVNIGDLAIAYAEKQLLNECGFAPFEITYYEVLHYLRILKTLLKNKTLILHGGGNMGDVWYPEELLRRSIIREIRAKKFIIMPQTIYYTNTNGGNQKEQESIDYYNNSSFLMFLRDKYSFDKARKLYPNASIYLSSDIVLSLDYSLMQKRNGKALLVFRDDIEKDIDDSTIVLIKRYLESKSIEYDSTSMLTQSKVTKNNYDLIVEEKFKKFSKYSFVITDRLHGMIFSTITSTPCIAFNNNNKKVEGTYSFIKDQGYVYLCNNYYDFMDKLDKAITNNDAEYKKELLDNYYDNIKKVIKANK